MSLSRTLRSGLIGMCLVIGASKCAAAPLSPVIGLVSSIDCKDRSSDGDLGAQQPWRLRCSRCRQESLGVRGPERLVAGQGMAWPSATSPEQVESRLKSDHPMEGLLWVPKTP
jgi:hypothetical protein